jgi:hypothetical protein
LKISVTYELDPPLRVEAGVEIVIGTTRIIIPVQNGFATQLQVAIHDSTRELLPRMISDPKPGVKMEIVIPPEIHKKTLLVARTFVACLGLFSFGTRLKTFPVHYDWEPDSIDEEPAQLGNFAIRRQRRSHDLLPAARIDQLTHCAVSVERMVRWADVLELDNAGHDNFLAERFADSLRYHFLVIESLYGAGKSNPREIVNSFLKHRHVVVATRSSIRYPRLYVKSEAECRDYRTSFPNEDVSDALLRLAKVRGQISHHNIDSPYKWTVSHQLKFKPEATLAANIAKRLVWRIARTEMWSPEVVAACGGIKD